jgi:phenylacetate-CoA ligase
MIPETLSRLWWRRYLRRNSQPWDELEQFPGNDPDQQRRILSSRLLQQVQYFGSRADALPEWRDAANITDPETLWRYWPSLPIVTKDTLRTHFQPRELKARFELSGVTSSSGGSTGEPTHFFHDMRMVRASAAALTYAQEQMGWRQGMPLIKVWGSERDIGRATKLRDRVLLSLLRTTIVDGYSMSENTVDHVLKLVRRNHPVALTGFTTMLEYVARKVIERGDTLRPGSVTTAWNGGEMLMDQQIEVFRLAFGVPILNLYGGREIGVMAFQRREGSPLQITRPWLFAELVDDSGAPVSPGETGRLLWTSTICRGTPFLRYEIGDLASFDSTHQTEAGITHLQQLQGRTSSLLKLPSGKVIQTLYWNHFFKDVTEVRQFQIVIQKDGGLRFLLVGDRFTQAKEAALRHTLVAFLGNIPLEFEWVERIPLTLQGKLIQVVRES